MTFLSPKKPVPKLRDNPRISGPWPFPDDVTSNICRRAGREASAMLCVALYKNKSDDENKTGDKNSSDGHGASAAFEAVYYETFTYWDWHAIHPDDDSAFNEKRQLLWERQRGFRHHGIKEGFPSPREAWIRFQSLISTYPERIPWVKKIAVAHWMTVEDVEWIMSTLTSVVALDLGDVPYLQEYINDFVDITYVNAQAQVTKDAWPLYIWSRSAAASFLSNLSWLGLPNFRDGTSAAPVIMVERLLPRCTTLRTLSIRGNYNLETLVEDLSSTNYLNYFENTLLGRIPASVRSLELRFSSALLEPMIQALCRITDSRISRVGIDLGAWIQMYPLHDQTHSHSNFDLSDEDVISTARLAAQRIFEDAYKNAQETHPSSVLSSRLPKVHTHVPPMDRDEAKSLYKRDFYGEIGGSGSYPVSIDTMMAMLTSVYTTGVGAALHGIHLEPLHPEWQAKSRNPIHPLAMIEKRSYEETSTKKSSRNDDKRFEKVQEAYGWLNENFNWRPIFDWDSICRPDSSTDDNDNNKLIEIAKHFRYLQKAKIPVHVLIGRRPPGQSSLCWGWPYDAGGWEKSITTPFDIGLEPVAAFIDTLSILYDLRNPLDQHRLEDIEMRQPYEGPEASCPRPICSWKNCPFKLQWKDRPSRAKKCNTKKTANEKQIQKMPYLPLASNLPSYPPTGEYPSDDPISNPSVPETLHQLAIRAAFDREALALQRFWATYALKLTNLTEVNIRMPAYFDKVRSWKLGRLIDLEDWKISSYAEEEEHMQTRQDVEYYASAVSIHTHSAQQKVWPAGRFVRRTWRKNQPATHPGVVKLTRGAEKVNKPNESLFGNGQENSEAKKKEAERAKKQQEAYDKAERKQFEKLVEVARASAQRERQFQSEISARGIRARRDPTIPPSEGIGSRLQDEYGRHIYNLARSTWTARMHGIVHDLHGVTNNPTSKTNKTGVEQNLTAIVATRDRLEANMVDFNPDTVFRVSDPKCPWRNGVDLVNFGRYRTSVAYRNAAIENERAAEADQAAEAEKTLIGGDEAERMAEEQETIERRTRLDMIAAKQKAAKEKAEAEKKAAEEAAKEREAAERKKLEEEKKAIKAKKLAEAKEAEARAAAERKRREEIEKAIEAKKPADAKEPVARAAEEKRAAAEAIRLAEEAAEKARKEAEAQAAAARLAEETRLAKEGRLTEEDAERARGEREAATTQSIELPTPGGSPSGSNGGRGSGDGGSGGEGPKPPAGTKRPRTTRLPHSTPQIVTTTRSGRQVIRPRDLTRTPTPLYSGISEDDSKDEGETNRTKEKEPTSADSYKPSRKRAADDSDSDDYKGGKKKTKKKYAKKPVKKKAKKGGKGQ